VCFEENKTNSKIAGLAAYKCFVNGATGNKMNDLLVHSFPNLMKMMREDDINIQYAIMDLFTAIAGCFPEVLMNDEILSSNYEMFDAILQARDPKLSMKVAVMWDCLYQTLNARDAVISGSLLYNYTSKIITALLKNAFRDDINNKSLFLVEYSLRTIVTIITSYFDLQLAKEFIPLFEQAIEEVVKNKRNSDLTEMLLEGLFICENTSLLTLEKQKVQVPAADLINIYKKIHSIFTELKRVTGEGIFAMAVVASSTFLVTK
jgi:hypothetical protein